MVLFFVSSGRSLLSQEVGRICAKWSSFFCQKRIYKTPELMLNFRCQSHVPKPKVVFFHMFSHDFPHPRSAARKEESVKKMKTHVGKTQGEITTKAPKEFPFRQKLPSPQWPRCTLREFSLAWSDRKDHGGRGSQLRQNISVWVALSFFVASLVDIQLRTRWQKESNLFWFRHMPRPAGVSRCVEGVTVRG